MPATHQGNTPTFSTLTDRELVVTQDFDAPRKLLWEAWSQQRHLANWLMDPDGWTMPVCEIDLRPGGKWRFLWRRPDGTEMGMHGEYRDVKPPESLVSTEKWQGDWPETLNSISFSESSGQTTMTIRVRYPTNEARGAVLAAGMTDGVTASFKRLADYLQTIKQ